MEISRDEMMSIPGISAHSEEGQYICGTEKALVEACKKTGIFLWADESGFHIHPQDAVEATLIQRLLMTLAEKDRVLKIGTYFDYSPFWICTELRDRINEHIKDDTSSIRRVTSWPIDRTFVYFDVSDFSKEDAAREVQIINSLIQVVENTRFWEGGYVRSVKDNLEASLCIGDGYIFVFRMAWCARSLPDTWRV